jgi:hypothetical protein
MALKTFDSFTANEEERNAYGQICLEAKALGRSGEFRAANIPRSIMELAVDSPYTMEKLAEDAKQLGEETVLQPHIRAVTPEQIGEKGEVETTKEFTAATDALGRGFTFFITSKEQGAQARSPKEDLPPALWVRIAPRTFDCIKESSGEVGRDEVYFSWGFGSDNQNKVSHTTDEFGCVSTSTSRPFPNNPPLFVGYTQRAVMGHMICWEADDSNNDFHNGLNGTMRDIADYSSEVTKIFHNEYLDTLLGLIPQYSQFTDAVFWFENILNFISNLLEIFRNDNDNVKECSYGWSRDSAEGIIHRTFMGTPYPYVVLEFDGGGGGHHQVRVQFTQD